MTDNLDIDANANVAAESFGSNLERMRKARGWTQSKLGDLSNVHMISVCPLTESVTVEGEVAK